MAFMLQRSYGRKSQSLPILKEHSALVTTYAFGPSIGGATRTDLGRGLCPRTALRFAFGGPVVVAILATEDDQSFKAD
jgi:hypothetical protein